jgi:hypothetical protein
MIIKMKEVMGELMVRRKTKKQKGYIDIMSCTPD